MSSWSSHVFEITFFIISAIVVIGAGSFAYVTTSKKVANDMRRNLPRLRAGKPALDEIRRKGHGTLKRLWAPLDEAIGFSLRVTSLSRMADFVASDVKVGSSRFRQVFHVATSDPDAAHRILTDEVCEEFSALGDTEFQLGSFTTFLLSDYKDACGQPDTKLRQLWMLLLPVGRFEDPALRKRALALAEILGGRISEEAMARTDPAKALRTVYAEGHRY